MHFQKLIKLVFKLCFHYTFGTKYFLL